MIGLFPLLSYSLGFGCWHSPMPDFASSRSASRFPVCSRILRLTFVSPLSCLLILFSGLKFILSYVSAKPAAVGLSCFRCLSFVCSCKAPPCFLTALILAQLFYSTRIPLRAHARPCTVEKRYCGLRLVQDIGHLKRTGGANHEQSIDYHR